MCYGWGDSVVRAHTKVGQKLRLAMAHRTFYDKCIEKEIHGTFNITGL